MENTDIISKIAYSNDDEKLGKIIRIDKLMGKTIKKLEPYAIIMVRRFLIGKLSIPIHIDKIVKTIEDKVIFDLTLKEFEKEKDRIKQIEQERKRYKEYPSGSWKDYQGGVRIPKRRGD